MRILLDHCVPRRLGRSLANHEVRTTREMGWERLENGDLMQAAASRFGAFLTVDKNIRHEHDLDHLPLPVIVLDGLSNTLSALVAFIPDLQKLLETSSKPKLYLIQPDGRIIELGNPEAK